MKGRKLPAENGVSSEIGVDLFLFGLFGFCGQGHDV
jgi:hypothetical protein